MSKRKRNEMLSGTLEENEGNEDQSEPQGSGMSHSSSMLSIINFGDGFGEEEEEDEDELGVDDEFADDIPLMQTHHANWALSWMSEKVQGDMDDDMATDDIEKDTGSSQWSQGGPRTREFDMESPAGRASTTNRLLNRSLSLSQKSVNTSLGVLSSVSSFTSTGSLTSSMPSQTPSGLTGSISTVSTAGRRGKRKLRRLDIQSASTVSDDEEMGSDDDIESNDNLITRNDDVEYQDSDEDQETVCSASVSSFEDIEQDDDNILMQFPFEVLVRIFRALTMKELNSIRLVCKRWYEVASSDQLWRQIFRLSLMVSTQHCTRKHGVDVWNGNASSSSSSSSIVQESALKKGIRWKKGSRLIDVHEHHNEDDPHRLEKLDDDNDDDDEEDDDEDDDSVMEGESHVPFRFFRMTRNRTLLLKGREQRSGTQILGDVVVTDADGAIQMPAWTDMDKSFASVAIHCMSLHGSSLLLGMGNGTIQVHELLPPPQEEGNINTSSSTSLMSPQSPHSPRNTLFSQEPRVSRSKDSSFWISSSVRLSQPLVIEGTRGLSKHSRAAKQPILFLQQDDRIAISATRPPDRRNKSGSAITIHDTETWVSIGKLVQPVEDGRAMINKRGEFKGQSANSGFTSGRFHKRWLITGTTLGQTQLWDLEMYRQYHRDHHEDLARMQYMNPRWREVNTRSLWSGDGRKQFEVDEMDLLKLTVAFRQDLKHRFYDVEGKKHSQKLRNLDQEIDQKLGKQMKQEMAGNGELSTTTKVNGKPGSFVSNESRIMDVDVLCTHDNVFALCGTQHGSVGVCDMAYGKWLFVAAQKDIRQRGLSSQVTSVRFGAEGNLAQNLILVGYASGEVRMFDTRIKAWGSQNPVQEFVRDDDSRPGRAAYKLKSKDQSNVQVSDPMRVTVLQPKVPSCNWYHKESQSLSKPGHWHGNHILSGYADGAVWLWDVCAAKGVERVARVPGAVCGLEWANPAASWDSEYDNMYDDVGFGTSMIVCGRDGVVRRVEWGLW